MNENNFFFFFSLQKNFYYLAYIHFWEADDKQSFIIIVRIIFFVLNLVYLQFHKRIIHFKSVFIHQVHLTHKKKHSCHFTNDTVAGCGARI